MLTLNMRYVKMSINIRRLTIILIAIGIIMQLREIPFALGNNEIEDILAVFKAREINGKALETIKETNKSDKMKKIEGGLYKFDISEDEMIAVVYDEENPTLCIFDNDMNELQRFDVVSLNGIMFSDDKLMLFWKDRTCGIYDVEGHLLSAYELTALRDYDASSKAAITYDKICYSNERIIGSEKYWLTDFTTRKPRNITKHTEYSFLVRENETGETTVLLRRMNTFWFKVLQIPIIILLTLASLFVLNLQYHFFDEIQAFIRSRVI